MRPLTDQERIVLETLADGGELAVFLGPGPEYKETYSYGFPGTGRMKSVGKDVIDLLRRPIRRVREYHHDHARRVWMFTLTPNGYRAIGRPVPPLMQPTTSKEGRAARLRAKIAKLEQQLADARKALAELEGEASHAD